MALTTYAELKDAIADQLARSDLTTQIPDFITLFEAEANRELFHHRLTETSVALATSSGDTSLPSDYMGWRRVMGGTNLLELEYLHPSIFRAYYSTDPSGVPQSFTIEGSVIKIRPVICGSKTQTKPPPGP